MSYVNTNVNTKPSNFLDILVDAVSSMSTGEKVATLSVSTAAVALVVKWGFDQFLERSPCSELDGASSSHSSLLPISDASLDFWTYSSTGALAITGDLLKDASVREAIEFRKGALYAPRIHPEVIWDSSRNNRLIFGPAGYPSAAAVWYMFFYGDTESWVSFLGKALGRQTYDKAADHSDIMRWEREEAQLLGGDPGPILRHDPSATNEIFRQLFDRRGDVANYLAESYPNVVCELQKADPRWISPSNSRSRSSR